MRDENPVMTFPIQKKINTELFIDERAELYAQRELKGLNEDGKNVGVKTNNSWK